VLSTTSPRRCTVAIAMIEPGAASPGISVARSFRTAKGFVDRVVGLSFEKDVARLRSADLALASVLAAPSPEDTDDFLERLAELRSRCPIDVLVPARSADAIALAPCKGELQALGIRTFLPTLAQLDLLRSAVYCSPTLPGAEAPNGAYAVAALGDGEGRAVGMVALRKIVAGSESQRWVGVVAQDETLRERVHALVSQTQLRGPMEIDLVRDPGEGGYRLVRIQPRFPGWVHLFASPGPNLPTLLVRLALGEEVEPQPELPGGPLLVGAAWEPWMSRD